MVGLFHAGPQLRRPADVAFAGHLGGRLAVFRPARESHAHAVDLGEAEHRARRAGDFSLRAQRRFLGPKLQPVWQWNHLPDDAKWSLTERPGYLRLHSLPARRFLVGAELADAARDRAGVDGHHGTGASGMKAGDVAGLALLNLPYAWIGVERGGRRIRDRAVRPDHRQVACARRCASRGSGCACTAISTPRSRSSATARTEASSSRSAAN